MGDPELCCGWVMGWVLEAAHHHAAVVELAVIKGLQRNKLLLWFSWWNVGWGNTAHCDVISELYSQSGWEAFSIQTCSDACSFTDSDIPVRVTATVCAWCYRGGGKGSLFQLAKSLSSRSWRIEASRDLSCRKLAHAVPEKCWRESRWNKHNQKVG